MNSTMANGQQFATQVDDAQGQLAGIEILDAAKRTGEPSSFRQIVLEGVGSMAAATAHTTGTSRIPDKEGTSSVDV